MTSMDKVASLRAFVKVVETGSFAEAGRQLRLSRSAISKYVAELEQSLGVQLLNRTTRHASPNENGQIYFERALTILSEIDAADEAVAHAQSSPSGLLRVNAPMSFGTIRLGPAIQLVAQPQKIMQIRACVIEYLSCIPHTGAHHSGRPECLLNS
jgi:DNA-binding transcriptional LysR family regulator